MFEKKYVGLQPQEVYLSTPKIFLKNIKFTNNFRSKTFCITHFSIFPIFIYNKIAVR